jgi:hypothetical protein
MPAFFAQEKAAIHGKINLWRGSVPLMIWSKIPRDQVPRDSCSSIACDHISAICGYGSTLYPPGLLISYLGRMGGGCVEVLEQLLQCRHRANV